MKKQDQKSLMSIAITPYFTLLVLKQINVVVIVIILMTHMQNFVFNLMSRTNKTRYMKNGMKHVSVNVD